MNSERAFRAGTQNDASGPVLAPSAPAGRVTALVASSFDALRLHAAPLATFGRALRALRQWRGRRRRSSISDIDDYRQCCARAASDAGTFARFRRDPAYTQILEHVGPQMGIEAARIALARHPEYHDRLDEFRRNDDCGGPRLHRFDGLGAFSPTTLRYVKILSDLESLFGDLSSFRVVEIGGGYGGQCRIIRSRFKLASYVIHDLPEAAALTQKYLEAFGIGDVSFNPPLEAMRDRPIDLVLSNYALSEIRRSVQAAYLAHVVSKAARGYMIWNESAMRRASRVRLPAADQPCSAEEIAASLPGARVERDVPLLLRDDVARGNALIVWP